MLFNFRRDVFVCVCVIRYVMFGGDVGYLKRNNKDVNKFALIL